VGFSSANAEVMAAPTLEIGLRKWRGA